MQVNGTTSLSSLIAQQVSCTNITTVQQLPTAGIKPIAPWECTNTYDVLVGAGFSEEDTPNYFLNGAIGGLHFYKRALSAEEITADATAEVGPETDGLVAAYDFQNITGLRVTDISGNGHYRHISRLYNRTSGNHLGNPCPEQQIYRTWKSIRSDP